MEQVQLIAVGVISVALFILLQRAFHSIKEWRTAKALTKDSFVELLHQTRKELQNLDTYQKSIYSICSEDMHFIKMQIGGLQEYIAKERFAKKLLRTKEESARIGNVLRRTTKKKTFASRLSDFQIDKEIFRKMKGGKLGLEGRREVVLETIKSVKTMLPAEYAIARTKAIQRLRYAWSKKKKTE